jgi:hypothetical protein
MSSWQRFSPILWAISWVWLLFPLLCRRSLVWCSLISSLFFSDGVFPTVTWSCFIVSGFILRSLIHFELTLVQSERQGASFSLLHVDIQFHSSICWRGCLTSIVCFGFFGENQLAIDAWVYVWIFYSDPLVFLSFPVPVPCCFIDVAL